MGGNKSKREAKARGKKPHTKKQKLDAKLVAIALIFVMLFVSYVVIFSSQKPQTKNMVFYAEEERGTFTGSVKNLPEDLSLSNITLTIRDSSSKSTKSQNPLQHGVVLETNGDFNLTFFDKNSNGKLDDEDEFLVQKASIGDSVKLYLSDEDEEIAYYNF